jgi:hypothetical protein
VAFAACYFCPERTGRYFHVGVVDCVLARRDANQWPTDTAQHELAAPLCRPDYPPAPHLDGDFDIDGHLANGGPVRRKRRRKAVHELKAHGGRSKPRGDRRPRGYQFGGVIGALARGLAGMVGGAELEEAPAAAAWAAGSGVRQKKPQGEVRRRS